MAVTTPGTRHVRLGAVVAVVALALVPWTAVLAVMLPERHVARHWDVAWAGFDLALSVSLLATGLAALRGREWLGIAATASGTLLLCDAWFDTLTASTGAQLTAALLLAGLVEVPLAVLCFLLAGGPRPRWTNR
jgi:hypothetical protein